MFGISGMELVLIAVFALIVFGPDKIPDIARTVGKAVKMFKRTQQDMERLIKVEMYSADPDKENSPFAPSDPFAAPNLTAAAKAAKAPKPATVASGLYAVTDEDEEDEE